MSLKTCRNCGVTTYPQSAETSQKRVWGQAGYKRQCGRGVCVNCYEHFRRAGRINELAFVRGTADQADPNAKVCGRCGIKHAMPDDLCQDCTDVVAALGELRAWEPRMRSA